METMMVANNMGSGRCGALNSIALPTPSTSPATCILALSQPEFSLLVLARSATTTDSCWPYISFILMMRRYFQALSVCFEVCATN